jgi:hypothetical protein
VAANPLTVDQFAAALKSKYPQYAKIPDTQLVQAVVTKYPQYKARIGGATPKPSTEMRTGEGPIARELTSFEAQSSQIPKGILDTVLAKRWPIVDAKNFSELGQDIKSLNPIVGMDRGTRSGGGDVDIGASAANLLPMIEGLRGKPKPIDATAPGGLMGAMTRGKQLLDQVDSAAKDIPVNYRPAYEWAKKAVALEPYGYTVPAPIKAFVNMIEGRMKPNAESLGGNSFIDRAASIDPLRYSDARNFEQSLGAKIPWDSDPGGKMGGIMKKMREALGQETATALKPHGLDVPYLKGKAEMTKAYGAREWFGPIGYIGGKMAGYGAGSVAGHPLILGYAGGKMGQSLSDQVIQKVVNAGGKQ